MAARRTARQKTASRKNLEKARKSKGGKGIAGGITHDAPGKVRQPAKTSGFFTTTGPIAKLRSTSAAKSLKAQLSTHKNSSQYKDAARRAGL